VILDVSKEEGGDALAVDACCVCRGESLEGDLLHVVEVESAILGNGVADNYTALKTESPLLIEDVGHLLGGVYAGVGVKAALTAVKRGEVGSLIAEYGDAHSLEIFESETDIKYGLRACADNCDGGVSQLLQVGGNVKAGGGASVNAADAAGSEYLDACHSGDDHGGGYGGGTCYLAGKNNGQIAAGNLRYRLSAGAEKGEVLIVETYLESAVEYSYGSGHSAVLSDYLLNLVSEGEVLRIGHTMRKNGGLERDNSLAVCESLGYLGGNVEILLEIHKKVPPVYLAISFTERMGLTVFSLDTATAAHAAARMRVSSTERLSI